MSRIHDEAFSVLSVSKDALDGKIDQDTGRERIAEIIHGEQNPTALIKEMTNSANFPPDFPVATVNDECDLMIKASKQDHDALPDLNPPTGRGNTVVPNPSRVEIRYNAYKDGSQVLVLTSLDAPAHNEAYRLLQTAKDFFDGKMGEQAATEKMTTMLNQYQASFEHAPRAYSPMQNARTSIATGTWASLRSELSRSSSYPSDFPIPQWNNPAGVLLKPNPADKLNVTSEAELGQESRAVHVTDRTVRAAKFAPPNWETSTNH